MVEYGSSVSGLKAGQTYNVVVPTKLPLGGEVKASAEPGLFRVYVPTREGGKLTIETTAGNIEMLDPSGQPAKDAEGAEVGSSSKVEFEVPSDGFGWWVAIVTGATSYTVSATFVIEGQAVDADGSPLVPWHFYYFPFSQVESKGDDHPAAKFDAAFGTQAYAWESESIFKSCIQWPGSAPATLGHSVTQAQVDAYNEHLGEDRYKLSDLSWWGHCDAATAASILFAQPTATGDLAESDLEWAATELAMNTFVLSQRFYLGDGDRSHPANAEVPNGESQQELDKVFGQFHETILDLIRNQGAAALMDLRASVVDGKDRSGDVWNQAVYKFEMQLKQAQEDGEDSNEEELARQMAVTTILYANADESDSSGNPEDPAGSGWDRHIEGVLSFDAKGKIAVTHPDNNCTSCTWNNKSYYFPRYAFEVKGLGPSHGGGNPEVKMAHLTEAGLALRKRYATT